MNTTSNLDNLIIKALDFTNKGNYTQAESLIFSILNNNDYLKNLSIHNWQFIAHICLIIGKFEVAKAAYIKVNNFEGVAFTCILMNDLSLAKTYLNKVDKSPVSLWCNFLIELFNNENSRKNLPSFLAIRHFMELTVYCLLLSGNNKFVDLLIKDLNKLLQINADSEKLIGYAYFQFGKYDEAIKFLNNSLKRDHSDGEIYFKLGQIYFLKNDFVQALSMLNNAKVILPEHYATELLLKEVTSKLST